MALLSPGVQTLEIDSSGIVPSVANSIAVFAGVFRKGQIGKYTLITNKPELETYYGLPSSENENDFFQCWNFLSYGNKLLVSRAGNIDGKTINLTDYTVGVDANAGDTLVTLAYNAGVDTPLKIGDEIQFSSDSSNTRYKISNIDNTDPLNPIFTLNITLANPVTIGDNVAVVEYIKNAIGEVPQSGGIAPTSDELYAVNITIPNQDVFEVQEQSLAFANSDTSLKFISKDPGTTGNSIDIAIANDTDFNNSTYAFSGILLDDLYEYYPGSDEIAVIIRENGEIVEKYLVSLSPDSKDINNKSDYIETIINNQSKYVYVKHNTANAKPTSSLDSNTLVLSQGFDSDVSVGDIESAYLDLFANKEELDVDIIIGNEKSPLSAINLAESRKDCIAFVGARYQDTVGKKATDAVANLINTRKNGIFNVNSMFACLSGNYKYQYNPYSGKNIWVNIAGDTAGLRAQTSSNRNSWWSSAGLSRGQMLNAVKLAFNPSQAQRDALYKNSINPVVSFPGEGTAILFGQKTLLSAPSSFDRISTRSLFNTIERSLEKMARYQIMEFNDTFTRNRIVAMITPFLSTIQGGRGIQDFLVINR